SIRFHILFIIAVVVSSKPLSEGKMQLLLFLWKSWKTFLRSRGWLATQCLVTLVCWAIAAFVLHKIATTFPLAEMIHNGDVDLRSMDYDEETQEIPEKTLTKLPYKCLNSSECDAFLTSICEPIQLTKKAQGSGTNCHPVDNPYLDGTLFIREFTDSSIDMEFSTHAPCLHQPPQLASDQFNDGIDIPWGCTAPPVFRQIAQEFGNLSQLSVRTLQMPRSFPSAFSYSEINNVLLFLYLIPIIFFTIQAATDVSEEANSMIKDYLLSMGMNRTSYFLHHFIFHFIKSWISVVILSAIIGFIFDSVVISSQLLLLFTLALASWISLSILVGSLFKRPGNAAILIIFLWIGMFLLYYMVNVQRTEFVSILFSLNPLTAISLAIDARREADFRG
ncbi:hypothetical protein PMAYCL1PPCAC_22769, partial [Pristionchus mayeri]